MKVAVIGGGASGLVSAITARRNGAEVTILEQNLECGKKILATGNGRCNYWNEDQDIKHYHSSNSKILEEILSEENKKEVLSFFQSIGIVPKIKNGYYYPFSNQAISIRNALVLEAKKIGVTFLQDFLVEEISFEKDKFVIHKKKEVLFFDKVILATGGLAAPKTGSTGTGYQFAKQFGHQIHPLSPGLVQLVSNGSFLKDWSGVRCEAEVSLFHKEKCLKKESGELQLTNYGLSGICIFNISRYASILLKEKENVFVKINFCPFVKESFSSWFETFSKKVKKRTIEELLEGILPYKLISILLKEAKIKRTISYEDCNEEERNRLLKTLTSFTLPIVDTKTFLEAQTTIGGVSLEEVNPYTMESLKQKGFYLVGELLDVDGDCGGYNLGFAWISGILAGKSIFLECE